MRALLVGPLTFAEQQAFVEVMVDDEATWLADQGRVTDPAEALTRLRDRSAG